MEFHTLEKISNALLKVGIKVDSVDSSNRFTGIGYDFVIKAKSQQIPTVSKATKKPLPPKAPTKFSTLSLSLPIARIPDKVIFNEKKRSTTLLYNRDEFDLQEVAHIQDIPNPTTYHAVTVKATKDDEYNKKLGFLIAYFQRTSGLSKSQSNKYLDKLLAVKVEPKVNINLNDLKVPELKKECKERGLKNYSKLKKEELIELLAEEVKSNE